MKLVRSADLMQQNFLYQQIFVSFSILIVVAISVKVLCIIVKNKTTS